ncbi:hypothetical protein GV794_24235 [Nocardia cyriacigeorgica]|uniref:Lipoprotein n=1 Tax=Nocardia cyriacigeorgica TaxID=135487 RepID=A0A6P1D719_9NOCA|nr:hypothetical protein [Nocardia cyriacigeorgica]NEW39699.1 hypothetical protein [Nocardia cyriacigeorgica]NEW46247.1 hypothetical protein [Nocardia cyriacigeorgica]NEW50189.1 hypothetical protein [Nocardia cyriacigeorgica]NEW58723.1 hypothetical protein [Nocardia cyriacigeorgica]
MTSNGSRRTGRTAAVGACVAAAIGLLSACAEPSEPTPVTTTTTAARTESPQERDRRIREQLIELGCTTNACIQIYFGCRDGYITGPDCDFYRRHPL